MPVGFAELAKLCGSLDERRSQVLRGPPCQAVWQAWNSRESTVRGPRYCAKKLANYCVELHGRVTRDNDVALHAQTNTDVDRHVVEGDSCSSQKAEQHVVECAAIAKSVNHVITIIVRIHQHWSHRPHAELKEHRLVRLPFRVHEQGRAMRPRCGLFREHQTETKYSRSPPCIAKLGVAGIQRSYEPSSGHVCEYCSLSTVAAMHSISESENRHDAYLWLIW